jgi:hypothetical protein
MDIEDPIFAEFKILTCELNLVNPRSENPDPRLQKDLMETAEAH